MKLTISQKVDHFTCNLRYNNYSLWPSILMADFSQVVRAKERIEQEMGISLNGNGPGTEGNNAEEKKDEK